MLRLINLSPRCTSGGVCVLYLNGLGYVHLINFNLWKATSRYIFILLIIAIKKVSSIYSDTDGSLGQKTSSQHKVALVE